MKEDKPKKIISSQAEDLPEVQNKSAKFDKIVIKSQKYDKFRSYEELIMILKSQMLQNKDRLVYISKQISKVFKDRQSTNFPEKILDTFKVYNVQFKVKDQK